MTQEEDRERKGRAGTKPQERRFEEELGSRQRKRKVGATGGRRKGCRRGVHRTKETDTDQFLHFFQLVSGKCYVVCVVRLEINITTQPLFYFLLSHKKAAGRSLSAPLHPSLGNVVSVARPTAERGQQVCASARVLPPGYSTHPVLSLYLRGHLSEVLPSACNSHQGSGVAMTRES